MQLFCNAIVAVFVVAFVNVVFLIITVVIVLCIVFVVVVAVAVVVVVTKIIFPLHPVLKICHDAVNVRNIAAVVIVVTGLVACSR